MLSKDDARVDIRIVGKEEGCRYWKWAVSTLCLSGPGQGRYAYDHVQQHHYCGHRSSLHSREGQGKGSSLSSHAVSLDMAAVLLDDLVGQGQAEPCACVFGGEERVEYLVFGGLV